jgi:hypothetical protein
MNHIRTHVAFTKCASGGAEGMRLLTRNGLSAAYILHFTAVARLWVDPSLQPPPLVDFSHELLDPTPDSMATDLATDLLAALGAPMRMAMQCAAWSSCLGAARVLTAPAPAMRYAVPRVA